MGTGTPGREAAFPSSPNGSRGRPARMGHGAPIPESGSGCFLVRPGGRFLVPALRSGTGVARRGGQGRAQARPKGLSLTAPSTAPGLGAVGTRKGSLRPARRRRADADREPATWRNCREHHDVLDRRWVEQRALPRPSNTVTGAPSNSVSGLTFGSPGSCLPSESLAVARDCNSCARPWAPRLLR